MKILLTGGSGFLGKSFIKAYGNKYDITAPSEEEMDLNKFEQISRQFKAKSFDAVVHLAARSERFEGEGIDSANLVFFKNIQYAAILYGVKKLIVAGDAADLNVKGGIAEATESEYGKTVPTDGYGFGQYLINLLASKDKISTVLRFFNIYGAGADPQKNPVVKIIDDARHNRSKTVTVDADRRISALYVADALKVISAFIDNNFPKGQYNVVPDDVATYFDIARKAKAAAKKNGREIKLVLNSSAPQEDEFTGKNDALRMLMPNLKFTGISKGVTKTYESL